MPVRRRSRQGDPIENLADQKMGLDRSEAFPNHHLANQQAEHRPRVAGVSVSRVILLTIGASARPKLCRSTAEIGPANSLVSPQPIEWKSITLGVPCRAAGYSLPPGRSRNPFRFPPKGVTPADASVRARLPESAAEISQFWTRRGIVLASEVTQERSSTRPFGRPWAATTPWPL